MPFVLVTVGVILLVAAIRNTQGTLFTLLGGDFTGPNNFIYWFVSILLIGAVGYIPKLKPFSIAFLTLVIMVLFLKRGDPNAATGGFFEKFTQALGTTTKNPASIFGTVNTPSGPAVNYPAGQAPLGTGSTPASVYGSVNTPSGTATNYPAGQAPIPV